MKKDNNSIQPVGLNDFFGKQTIEKAGELFDYLNQRIIKRAETGITLRILNHWIKERAIDTDVNEFKRFTFVEFIWIKIVEELRKAGYPLPLIVLLKENLFAPIKIKGIASKLEKAKDIIEELKISKEEKERLLQLIQSENAKPEAESGINMLHIFIIESILKKLPLSIAVFLDSTYLPIDESKAHLYTEADKLKRMYETHITISLSKILKEFLLSDLSGFVVPKIQLLSYPENKLFEVMQSGEYDSITIHFKDKKIKSLELKKSEDVKKRMVDILSEGEYGEIVVKKHKGVVTKIENTVKVHL